jgi:outer membrane protein assembly factor BamB
MGDGHLRPHAMVFGPDDRVYVGSLAPYGQRGGALGVYDPKADAVTENYRNIVTNQSISALCFEPRTGLLFVGSSVEAGGGATPAAGPCVVFAWNTKARRKVWEAPVVAGEETVSVLAAADGKVFGVTYPSSTLFALDARTFKVLCRNKISFGAFQDVSLGYCAPRKRLYGLAGQSLFQLDPANLALTEAARSPETITCGFAVTDTGIYFGSGTRLVRWSWPDSE